jgi:hypothetical protein
LPYLRLPTGRSALRIIFIIIIIGGKAIGRWLGLTYEQVRPLIDDQTIPTFKLPGHTKRCALKSILYETFAKYAQRFSYEICPANARQHPIAKMVFALWCRCEMVGLKNVPPASKDNRCTATNRRGSSRERAGMGVARNHRGDFALILCFYLFLFVRQSCVFFQEWQLL